MQKKPSPGIIAIDGNGVELGELIGFEGERFYYLNNNGYIVQIYDGTVRDPGYYFYTTSNCTGNLYIMTTVPGTVYRGWGNLYYVPKDAVAEVKVFYSMLHANLDPSWCDSAGPPGEGDELEAIQVLPNDPSITGESSVMKTPPIRIIRRGDK